MKNPNVYWDLFRQAKEGNVVLPDRFSDDLRRDYLQVIEEQMRPLLALRDALLGQDVLHDRSAADLEAAERIVREKHATEANVKLEPGMVGVMKYADDVPPEIQGASFQVVRVSHIPGYAECAVDGLGTTFMVRTSQMAEVGMPAPSLGDLFSTKEVDGHVLAGLDKDALIKALKDAPVGTVITGVRDASGRYDFDTHIEKHGGYVRNHFAPVKTADYDTWWEVGGSKRHEYDLVDILQGKSKYYALAEKEDGTSMNEKDTGVRDLAGRLVEFMKDYDFYHFQDALGAGGEEEAVQKIEQDLKSENGVISLHEAVLEVYSDGELSKEQASTIRGLIEDLTVLGKGFDSRSSLDEQIQSAKDKERPVTYSLDEVEKELGLDF